MNKQEAVMERIQKDEVDKQWNQYHETQGNGKNQSVKPSQKQKTYIFALARTVGMRIDVSNLDKKKASELIDRLKTLSQKKNGNGNGYENNFQERDKRIGFGMATKLIFQKYLELHLKNRGSKEFWEEVEEFYKEYQKHQEGTVSSPFVDALELHKQK